MQKETTYKQLCQEIVKCCRCPLYRWRTKAVPGQGSLKAKIVFIGEAPGRQEDKNGRPFCGSAGKILDQLLNSINLNRKRIFITNLVKCRPPQNRPPRLSEIKSCQYFLDKQLKLIGPKIIIPLGKCASKFFLNKDSLNKVHGKIFKQKDFLVIPMYHPAAALYQRKLLKVLKKDFKKIKELL